MDGLEDGLTQRYLDLEWAGAIESETAINPGCLLTFPYEFPESEAEIRLDTDEFSAVCPWTGLPDSGTLELMYVPQEHCIELKSFKYYLLSYRSVGIVQEHAANRILWDLVNVCMPRRMSLTLDYKTRGGIHTVVVVSYPQQ
tara:strand:+ start:156 stop:581 length:426 start_codon:yes stop_codon:yes gene_type:complete